MSKKSSAVEEKAPSDKKEPKKAPQFNVAERIATAKAFLKETWIELKKVQWPTRRQAAVETVVVLVTVAFITVLVVAFDAVLATVANGLFSVQ